ncbi:MAG: FHA domain-containing protein [Phycisphaerae bacterium]|nr:FHA domain-containing protein [Phycisphaerae bacterium]
MACLVITSGPEKGTTFRLTSQPMICGRYSRAEVQILDIAVSRQHFEIRPADEDYVIRELANKHGVFVNQVKITGEHRLQDGDEIKVGNTHLKFYTVAPPESGRTRRTRHRRKIPEDGATGH